MILADIASGNVDAADWFFLIGVILGVLAALLYAVGHRPVRADGTVAPVGAWAPTVGWLGVAFVALGLLVL